MAPDEGEARRLWAELERMPTPQRARSAIVTLEEDGADGGGRSRRKAVVDVGQLGPGQRRALLDRLVGSADRDNERFLRELREYESIRCCVVQLLGDVLISRTNARAMDDGDGSARDYGRFD